MVDYSTLAIVGVGVTLLTQLIKYFQKKYTSLGAWFTVSVAFGLSLLIATIYFVYQSSPFWETLGGIFTVAGAVYTYLISRFEK